MLAPRRLHELKASTTMDLGISIFLIFVRCVALRNLELLIKTGWNVVVRFVAENALVVRRRQRPESIEKLLSIWSKEV